MARPPRLADSTILALIEELRAQHGVLTGTRLREELARRHGTPCGVSRVYRLLHQATHPQPASSSAVPLATGDIVELQTQLAAALERARLAEYREESHQTRWAGEIHALREQLRDVSNSRQRVRWLEDEIQNKARELASAFLRIADLEAQLERLSSG